MSTRALSAFVLLVPSLLASSGACGGTVVETNAANGGSSGAAGNTGLAGTGNTAGGITAGGTSGIPEDIRTTCSVSTDCVIEPVKCCDCGTGPVTDYIAVNSGLQNVDHTPCNTADCGGCGPVAYDPNNPYFYYVPTCQDRHCRVVDLRTTDITACQIAADCVPRGGTACCSGCANGDTVAINAKEEGALENLVCGADTNVGCGVCGNPVGGVIWPIRCEAGRCVFDVGCTASSPCPL